MLPESKGGRGDSEATEDMSLKLFPTCNPGSSNVMEILTSQLSQNTPQIYNYKIIKIFVAYLLWARHCSSCWRYCCLLIRQISEKLIFQSERYSKNKHRSSMISDANYYKEKLSRIRKRGLIRSLLQHLQLGGRDHTLGFFVCSSTFHNNACMVHKQAQ